MHEQVLTKEAASLLPTFQQFEAYYLVDGTALALQIGHRISVDFDFFSSEELPSNLLARVKRAFLGSSIAVTYAAPEQLNLLIDTVKVTFLHYPYSVCEPFVFFKEIPLANTTEIAAMKAFSVGRRLAYKDYVDWYFLLRDGSVNLKYILALAQKKFGTEFNDRLFLSQLVSFEDIPIQKIDFLGEPIERGEIEEFLHKTVQTFEL